MCQFDIQFKKYGKLIPNALTELKKEITIDDLAYDIQLKYLDFFVNFLYRKKPSILKVYLLNLEKKFDSLVDKGYPLIIERLNFDFVLAEYNILKNYQELIKKYLNYIFETLQIRNYDDFVTENVEFTIREFLRAFLLPRYYLLQVLTETVDRDEAIQLYKILVTQKIIENSSPSKKTFDTVNEFKEFFERDKKEVTIGWIGVLGEVVNGKFFFRKDNCLWAEALQDIPDKELKYLVCCYGDFQAAASRGKGNFILTMKHTIIEGDSFCDCIYHDTNISWDLTHPPKEFWESIKPK